MPATKNLTWKSTKGSTERSPIFAAAEAEAQSAANIIPRKMVFKFNLLFI
jgi:hypothetical protein